MTSPVLGQAQGYILSPGWVEPAQYPPGTGKIKDLYPLFQEKAGQLGGHVGGADNDHLFNAAQGNFFHNIIVLCHQQTFLAFAQIGARGIDIEGPPQVDGRQGPDRSLAGTLQEFGLLRQTPGRQATALAALVSEGFRYSPHPDDGLGLPDGGQGQFPQLLAEIDLTPLVGGCVIHIAVGNISSQVLLQQECLAAKLDIIVAVIF